MGTSGVNCLRRRAAPTLRITNSAGAWQVLGLGGKVVTAGVTRQTGPLPADIAGGDRSQHYPLSRAIANCRRCDPALVIRTPVRGQYSRLDRTASQ
jgi:hypothetical protein